MVILCLIISVVQVTKPGIELMDRPFKKIVKQNHSERIRIEVDVESYRKTRKNNRQRQAAKMAEIGLWAQMWGVTDVEPEQMSKLFIKPFSKLQAALDAAIEEKGKDASVLFLMDGGLTVPLVQ